MEIQVKDDFQLLDLMNSDMEKASQLYKPTNYWEYKAHFLQPALKEEGLKDFRRKTVSVYASIGGIDVYPRHWLDLRKNRLFNNRILRKIKGWESVLQSLNSLLDPIVKLFPKYVEKKKRIPYDYAVQIQKESNAMPVDMFEASLAGNPQYVINVNGKIYTNNIFDYYIRYAYCCRFIDFNSINTIVELGSGSCKLTEVIRKLHPHITFYNFDISPQLYVGERYLETVFGDDLVSYRSNRVLNEMPVAEPGKIYMMGSWQFPLLKNFKFDLFFNLTSFQEMEPDVVANYLSFINGNAKYVYLHSKMDGKEVAQKKGNFGVLKPTTIEDFKKGLSFYELRDIRDSYKETGELKWNGHKDSFWALK